MGILLIIILQVWLTIKDELLSHTFLKISICHCKYHDVAFSGVLLVVSFAAAVSELPPETEVAITMITAIIIPRIRNIKMHFLEHIQNSYLFIMFSSCFEPCSYSLDSHLIFYVFYIIFSACSMLRTYSSIISPAMFFISIVFLNALSRF